MTDEVGDLVGRLTRLGLTLTTAESLTGGSLAAAIVAVPGASACFRGGVVAYATDVKSRLLDVPAELLDARGPVDPEVAALMAAGVRSALLADIGVSTTGVAGPEAQCGVLPGTVFIGLDATIDDRLIQEVRRLDLAGGRSAIRAATVIAALDLVREVLGPPAG